MNEDEVNPDERALIESKRLWAREVASVFNLPPWLICDDDLNPTPEERARWRREIEKVARRRRYRRRYARGPR
jgi:phage portal protein BeeE